MAAPFAKESPLFDLFNEEFSKMRESGHIKQIETKYKIRTGDAKCGNPKVSKSNLIQTYPIFLINCFFLDKIRLWTNFSSILVFNIWNIGWHDVIVIRIHLQNVWKYQHFEEQQPCHTYRKRNTPKWHDSRVHWWLFLHTAEETVPAPSESRTSREIIETNS